MSNDFSESDKKLIKALMIGKEIGLFSCAKDNPKPQPSIGLWLDAMEEKSKTVGKDNLSEFQVALFTFLHEFEHYRQWKGGRVTTAELHDPKFGSSEKAQQLEKEADDAALLFISEHGPKFSPLALTAMTGRMMMPNIKVGYEVELTKDITCMETIYFDDKFHCGRVGGDVVDLGLYKVTIKKGTKAIVNSIDGSGRVELIELSSTGHIAAYDNIRGRELRNEVIVHTTTTNVDDLQRVD